MINKKFIFIIGILLGTLAVLIFIKMPRQLTSVHNNDSETLEQQVKPPPPPEPKTPSIRQTDTGEYELDLNRPETPWQAQTYEDSRGVAKVYFDADKKLWVMDCDLKGQHPNLEKGEMILKLENVPDLLGKTPLDMRKMELAALLDVPAGLVGDPHNPNSCCLFVKDTEYHSQYGSTNDVTGGGALGLSLVPSKETPVNGWTDQAGFLPDKIVMVGVKCSINPASTHQFKGRISVKEIVLISKEPL